MSTRVDAVQFSDDFTNGLNLPWTFIDEIGDSPPEFTEVSFGDDDQNLKFLGSAAAFEDDFAFHASTTGYVGLDNADYFFENEVHVTATFSPLQNMTLGFEEGELANNDVFVVARGEGVNGYIFALDAFHAEADLVRIDEGAVVQLGETAILRDLAGIEQDGTYTLRISAVDDLITGQLFDDSMELLGEVSVRDDIYENGWAGVGAAINDGGDEGLRTLIASSFDDFQAADTLNVEVEIPTIDELTAAINAGLSDSKFDIDQNGSVNSDDRTAWVVTLNNTYFGDSNLDGEFNSQDFVIVFQAGEYEDGVAGNSLWSDGDWNGDGEFSSSDFVIAFQGGGFEQGPRAAESVPEPSSLVLLLIGLLGVARVRRQA